MLPPAAAGVLGGLLALGLRQPPVSLLCPTHARAFAAAAARQLSVAIVGSGPAGFYTADKVCRGVLWGRAGRLCRENPMLLPCSHTHICLLTMLLSSSHAAVEALRQRRQRGPAGDTAGLSGVLCFVRLIGCLLSGCSWACAPTTNTHRTGCRRRLASCARAWRPTTLTPR
jgi:hypothetical protein